MKKILLTGSSGMVGKNILEHHLSKEYILITPDISELDLMNFKAVDEYIKDNLPDMIIHCAGIVGGIQANINDPERFFLHNIEIGINMVKASKKNNIKRFLNFGSSCMYPRDFENPLKEEFILKGELEPTNEGYALAKIGVAKYCEYISEMYSDFCYKTIIPCNLYGRWDKFSPENSHMIPAVIRKIDIAVRNNEGNVEIWGDGTARREFMYAGDLADFIFYCLSNFDKMPQYLNVGTGKDYSIKEYYDKIAEVIGFVGNFTFDVTKPAGMKQKVVSIERLNSFGWKSKYSLDEGIRNTFEFYKKEVMRYV